MFALFAGDHYYPRGGWGDLVGVFATQEAAERRFHQGQRYEWYDEDDDADLFDWGHVVDLDRQVVVARF